MKVRTGKLRYLKKKKNQNNIQNTNAINPLKNRGYAVFVAYRGNKDG